MLLKLGVFILRLTIGLVSMRVSLTEHERGGTMLTSIYIVHSQCKTISTNTNNNTKKSSFWFHQTKSHFSLPFHSSLSSRFVGKVVQVASYSYTHSCCFLFLNAYTYSIPLSLAGYAACVCTFPLRSKFWIVSTARRFFFVFSVCIHPFHSSAALISNRPAVRLCAFAL